VQGNTFNLISGIGVNVIGEGNAEGRIGGDTAANQSGPVGANQGNTFKQAGSLNGCAEDAIRIDDYGNFKFGQAPVTTWTVSVRNNFTDAHNGVDVGAGDLCTGGSGDQGIVFFVRDSAGTLNGTVQNNIVQETFAQGMRVFVADRDPADGVSNGPNTFLSVTGNSFSTIGGAEAISMSVDDLADLWTNISGNTGNGPGGSPEGNIFLDRCVTTTTFGVTQASTAAISTANSGAPVTLGPVALNFNTPCNPPLPGNGWSRAGTRRVHPGPGTYPGKVLRSDQPLRRGPIRTRSKTSANASRERSAPKVPKSPQPSSRSTLWVRPAIPSTRTGTCRPWSGLAFGKDGEG
jgi:hypothetical protein